MAVDKPTISMDSDLRAEVDRLASAEGVSFSAFVARAVANEVRRRKSAQELLSVIASWEREHGRLSDAEMAAAAAELGLPARPRKRRVRSTTVAGRSIRG